MAKSLTHFFLKIVRQEEVTITQPEIVDTVLEGATFFSCSVLRAISVFF